MSDVTLKSGGASVVAERFTGQVRWLADKGTSTRPPKLQQLVEVTTFEHWVEVAKRSYEWRDVPTTTGEDA